MAEYREATVALTLPPLIFSLQGGVTLSSSVSTGAKKIRLMREGVRGQRCRGLCNIRSVTLLVLQASRARPGLLQWVKFW